MEIIKIKKLKFKVWDSDNTPIDKFEAEFEKAIKRLRKKFG